MKYSEHMVHGTAYLEQLEEIVGPETKPAEITAQCHPSQGIRMFAVLADGTVESFCAVCGNRVVKLKIARFKPILRVVT